MEKIRIEMKLDKLFRHPNFYGDQGEAINRFVALGRKWLKHAVDFGRWTIRSVGRTGFRSSDFPTSIAMVPRGGSQWGQILAAVPPAPPPPAKKQGGGITFIRGKSSGIGWRLQVVRIAEVDLGSMSTMECILESFGFGVWHCTTREQAESRIARLRATKKQFVCYHAIPDQGACTQVNWSCPNGERVSMCLDFPPPWYLIVYNSTPGLPKN